MHKLRNGSQVTARPTRKSVSGTEGYFSENNAEGAPSYPGQDWYNDCIDEFLNALAAMGITYDPTKLDHLATAFKNSGKAFFLKHMLFKGMPMSAVGPTPEPEIWLPAGRVELLRADYTTVFAIVSATGFFTDQAIIDADPRAYAGHWGDGDGETTFTTDDWALMMNIKVAGGYGAAGSTKEDHIQNITGGSNFGGRDDRVFTHGQSGVDGALKFTQKNTNNVSTGSGAGLGSLDFDASLVARTDTYTDTMGLFLDHYRVIPKGVFSYA